MKKILEHCLVEIDAESGTVIRCEDCSFFIGKRRYELEVFRARSAKEDAEYEHVEKARDLTGRIKIWTVRNGKRYSAYLWNGKTGQAEVLLENLRSEKPELFGIVYSELMARRRVRSKLFGGEVELWDGNKTEAGDGK